MLVNPVNGLEVLRCFRLGETERRRMEWVRGCVSSNGLAILTLDRPKALNAMNLDMDIAYKRFLDEWESSPSVKAVLVESSSSRAFSAGGDVKWMTTCGSGLKGLFTVVSKSLAAEYTLICAIARYKKPYISLMDGITMGFGIGLSGHGKYRVVTEKTVLAMPENGIGLFPDVGFAHIAARTPGSGAFGAYLGLCGARVSKPADALFLGLGTHYVPSEKLPALKESLLTRDLSTATQAVEQTLAEFSAEAGPSDLENVLPVVSSAFGRDKPVLKSIQALEKEQSSPDPQVSEWAKGALTGIKKGAPFSLALTHKHFSAVASEPSCKIEDVMRVEYRLAIRAALRDDFAEGVRAVLIDKDQKPRWSPSKLDEVDPIELESLFHPMETELPV